MHIYRPYNPSRTRHSAIAQILQPCRSHHPFQHPSSIAAAFHHPSTHQTLIHTHPTTLPVPLHPPNSILHHQNNPEIPNTQSAASKEFGQILYNCLALQSELLNDFRCFLSCISMSNSCNLCFALSMIG